MTVKELKDLLDTYPDDFLVVMSKDSEGNGFSPLDCIDEVGYDPDNRYSGQIYSIEEESADTIEAICLWPIN